jgi:glycerol-3-phosphate dehydrogenase (NAD(P)+)
MPNTPNRVAVVGAGEIGSALAYLIRKSGCVVELWDKDPAKVPNQKPLAEIIPGASAVILGVPSWAMRPALESLKPYLTAGTVVVSLAKGIEHGTRHTMDEVMFKSLPTGVAPALLGGPMLAEELMKDMVGVAVLATERQESFDQVRALFSGAPFIRLEWSADLRLTALLGVLKNIYSVGLGIVDGLKWGMNAQGWFTARAIREMDAIIMELHGVPDAVCGSSGVGDYIATGFSPYSRNRESGHEIVATGACNLKSEGCVSLPSIIEMVGARIPDFQILMTLNQVLYGKVDVKTAFERLLHAA